MLLYLCLIVFDLAEANAQKQGASDDKPSNTDLVQSISEAIKPAPLTYDSGEVININHGRSRVDVNLNSGSEQQKFGKGIRINVSESPEDEEEYLLEDYVNEAYDAALVGQLEVAAFLYKKALEIDKNNLSIKYSLATIYHKQNEYEQAKRFYNSVLTADPKHFKALNNLLALMGQENPHKALADLQELAQINPSYSPLQAQIGIVLLELGDIKAAEEHLRKAVMLDPVVPQYRYNLALLYERMRKPKLALQLYNSLLQDYYRGMEIPISSSVLQKKIIDITINKKNNR
jgi:tetratricopeptide (TPR) repeat protein